MSAYWPSLFGGMLIGLSAAPSARAAASKNLVSGVFAILIFVVAAYVLC